MKWAEIFTRNEKGFRRKTRVGEEAGAKKGSANWMIETPSCRITCQVSGIMPFSDSECGI